MEMITSYGNDSNVIIVRIRLLMNNINSRYQRLLEENLTLLKGGLILKVIIMAHISDIF